MVGSCWYVILLDRFYLLSQILIHRFEPATGTHTVWSISQLSLNSDSASVHTMQQWVISFYLTAIVTNFIATSYDPSTVASQTKFTNPCYLGTLALKLWLIHRHSSRLRSTGFQVYPILFVIMECGALYSLSLVTMLATYFSGSNGSFIVLDMVHTSRNERRNPPC